mgnify:FL=1|tara:strand:+ start:310 stop:609 length:300 start_codon:yes stop_codon:yes gene_type:complete
MLQREVIVGHVYRVKPENSKTHTLCKVKQYGQIWCKAMSSGTLLTASMSGQDLIKRYNPAQVALVVDDDGATECWQVLVDGEVLTMHGRSWRSMEEVKQ